jgi:DNA/RNA-binding domain of Phe-tRNA-synthetase-like protein
MPNQVILCDEADKDVVGDIIAVYPYRDSDSTKVTLATKNMHIVSCGVPGVSSEKVLGAYRACASYLERYCSGASEKPSLYP